MRTLGAASIVVAETVAIVILVGRFGDIGGWDAAQVAWLVGVANAGLGFGMLVGDAIEPPAFSNLIREGRIDAALTRPLSPLLWVVTSDVQIRELGRAAAGLGVVVWASVAVGVDPSVLTVAITLLAVVATAVIVFSILVIGAAVTMFTIEGTELVNAFTYGGTTLSSYPIQIYSSAIRAVFLFVIPLALVVYVPALWVLDETGPPGVPRSLLALTPIATVAFAGVAAACWRAGLRHYESTGS
jgi:ABC-2 type transport system permease protein